tara:strand:- start:546 stop:1190 length:645 start_codon:yes stop_codon:yes gene_type:complete
VVRKYIKNRENSKLADALASATVAASGAEYGLTDRSLSPSEYLYGAARSLGHGLTGGYSDEIVGRISQLSGGDYESARDAERAKYKEFAELYPVTDLIADSAGAANVATAGWRTAGRYLPEAVEKVRKSRLLQSLLGGAAGALYGIGYSDAPLEETPTDPGVIGMTAIGGVIPYAPALGAFLWSIKGKLAAGGAGTALKQSDSESTQEQRLRIE